MLEGIGLGANDMLGNIENIPIGLLDIDGSLDGCAVGDSVLCLLVSLWNNILSPRLIVTTVVVV